MNHTALITGAGSGLGKYLALECASRGFNLVLVSLPHSGLDLVAAEIAIKHNIHPYTIEADFTEQSAPAYVFTKVKSAGISVSILINNAGIGMENAFESLSVTFCSDLLNVNTHAVALLTRFFLDDLQHSNQAYILNVSSLACFTPMPYKGIYSASKAFVYSFSRALAAELKSTSVSVSTLCPGPIPTNEQTRSRIQRHGIFARVSAIEADKVARIAISEMLDLNPVIIPGRINRINKFLMSAVPKALQLYLLHAKYSTAVHLKANKIPSEVSSAA
ncbi:MAG TPA: SDR family NAD(P)-dependent oxidoreductase [Bacteroidia bacterium]|nr:SDR family NAD(P)-dependent oxidoreductase [Bacteroidia bacterium]